MFGIKQRAFTLVEMLVVIGIMAILAVLLLPVFHKMMDRMTAAKFCSNLRTVAAALHGYAADNNETFPAFVDKRFGTGGSAIHWQGRIASYLGEDIYSPKYSSAEAIRASVLHDPADKTSWPGGGPQRNVAINGTTILDENGNPEGGTTIMGATARHLPAINRPSALMLVGPGADAQYSTIWGSCARFGFDGDLSHSQRYKEGMYFAFADGHVALKTTPWVQYEYDHRYESAFMDWSANNPTPLVNPAD